MPTLSSLNAATTVGLVPLVDSVSLVPSVSPNAPSGQSALLSSPSTVVTIPSSFGAVALETYTPQGVLAGAAPAITTANDSRDAVTLQMLGSYTNAQTMTGQFSGVGSALLDRFKTTGSDFSQSVSTTGGIALPTLQGPEGKVHLAIKTQSGVTVDIEIDSEGGSLSASIQSSGKLSDSERSAVAQLATGFQRAIDGLGTVPPKLDLSGLTQFDTSALASVNFQYNVTNDGNANVSASYSQDRASRSLSLKSAEGAIDVSVDTSNPALWGTSAQRAASVASYLQQFDQANSRGHGNAALMSMFEDGFAQMNQDYGTPSAQVLPGTAYAPTLQQASQAMLTGLGDFSASITDATTSPNPLRPGEVNSFSYQVSQSTKLSGSQNDGQITQRQQSHLSASYHQALSGAGEPALTSSRASQNYRYVQIDDSASSTVQIATERGALLNASLSQSSDRKTRESTYEAGKLISDVTTPEETSRSSNLLALLQPLIDSGDATHNSAEWQQALTQVHSMIQLSA
ncbi:hypothetical protein GQ56_0115040 [Burkholderia paludis]|uniref:hypothetical protein n=1 Tax=Burkholderia paludis TaxID=1506587 RepID=UPI0004DB902F|nr:hypothetical protein [Burkholderia paludis]KFG96390.1 hypothetical protein GQ56_0115040 [Burkholderia paludis]